METQKHEYIERDKALGRLRITLAEILVDTGNRLVEVIKKFVDDETRKRPMLDPLLPVNGIQIATFR